MQKKIVIICLSLTMLILGCQKNDHPSPSPSGELSFSRTAIRLDTTIRFSDTIVIHSTVPWTAVSSAVPAWFQLDKTKGEIGTTVVKITVLSNNGAAARTAMITLSASDNSQTTPATFTLTQKPYTLSLNWQKNLGGSSDDGVNAMVKTADGGSALAGYTSSTDGDVSGNHGNYDFWVVKLDDSGNKQWAKTFGGSGDDEAYSIVATSDGGFAVTGYTGSSDGDVTGNRGHFDMWVIKLDGSGNLQWAKTFGGGQEDFGKSIVATADGGFLVAGYTNSTDGDVTGNHGGNDMWIVKLDGSGNKQWTKTFGGNSDDICFHIISSTDGGYLLAGSTLSNDGDVAGNHGGNDMWIVKLDGAGNKQWTKTFGGSGNDYAFAVTVNPAGGFTIAGATTSNDGDVSGYHGGLYDILAVNIDGSGNKLWAKTIGGSDIDYALSIVSAGDGGCVIAGWTYSPDGDVNGYHGNGDLWVVKLDNSGDKQWAKALGGTGNDYARGIIATSDGGYTVAGGSTSSDGDLTGNHGYFDLWTVKLGVQ